MLFRLFVAFCICAKFDVIHVTLQCVLAYLEFLARNNVSPNMVANHVSALKSKFIMYDLNYHLLEHPKIRYFVRSMKINRPLIPVVRNIMSIETLTRLVLECDGIYGGKVFKAIFLMGFFGFLRISNLAPHAVRAFDPSSNLTIEDISITKTNMTVVIKWSKTLQTRDKVHLLTLPRLPKSPLCPVKALKRAVQVYKPQGLDPLFQIYTLNGWQVVTDSRIRKVLSRLNVKMGFSPNHFTFHTFRRSGATLAYNAHVPIQKIKHHGSWTSDCVWRYIQQDSNYSQDIAASFASVINAGL